MLFSTLGYHFFRPKAPKSTASPGSAQSGELPEVFICKGSQADGKGNWTNEGMVVLAGSSGRAEVVDSLKEYNTHRAKLLAAGILEVKDGRIVFTKDHIFKSPSGAAVVLMGRSANGWEEWKASSSGVTLGEIERSPFGLPQT